MHEVAELNPVPLLVIDELSAWLLPDRKRVRASLVLSDAASRHTIKLTLQDQQQVRIARTTIIGIFDRTVNFTLHLGSHNPEQPIYLHAAVFKDDGSLLNSRQVKVESDG